MQHLRILLTAFLVLLMTATAAIGDGDMAIDNASVRWEAKPGFEELTLSISGPEGFYLRQSFGAGQAPAISLFTTEGGKIPDGSYTWEIVGRPQLSAEQRAKLEGLRASGADMKAYLPAGWRTSGHFRVASGAFVVDNLSEGSGKPTGPAWPTETLDEAPVSKDIAAPAKDQVILDDLIVEGSICAGLDCANGESFGFDTLRLKENNLRIKFQDTSATASFPSNDWQITANDSSNGGMNKYSIDDIDGGRTPFTIEASAPSHSLYVDDGGRIGLGTSTPVVELHVKNGDSPTLRLEQDGSSGFTPQTWDVAGNETNFFIRDVSNGSTLPFRIRPDAPTSAIDVEGNTGDVGFGTTSPTAPIHVLRSNQTAKILVQETNGTAGERELLEMANNGSVRMVLNDTRDANRWLVRTASNSTLFRIRKEGSAGTELEINGTTGDVTARGMISGSSDRNLKRDIHDIDPQDVLSRLLDLPISTWSYKVDPSDTVHLGPMAQDFYSLFGLGGSETKIQPHNMSAVALAAIQAVVAEKDAQIADLEERLARLEALITGNE